MAYEATAGHMGDLTLPDNTGIGAAAANQPGYGQGIDAVPIE
jgi:hypothetical protein